MPDKEIKRRGTRVGRIDSPMRVAVEQARVYRRMARGELDINDGHKLVSTLAMVRQSQEVGLIEMQIEELQVAAAKIATNDKPLLRHSPIPGNDQ
jgi:hypothetical protein